MHHVIMEQVFDLTVHSKADHFAVQQRISTLWHDEICPKLEELFDSISVKKEMISVEKMEIDIGEFREEDLYRKLSVETMVSLVISQLREKLAKGLVVNDPDIKVRPKLLSVFEQWVFYMQKGFRSWQSDKPGKEWNDEVLQALAMEYTCADRLRELLKNDMRALERIVFLHDPVFLSHLVELLTAKNQQALTGLPAELKLAFLSLHKGKSKPVIPDAILVHSVWKFILQMAAVAATTSQVTAEYIIRRLIRSVFTRQQIIQLSAKKSVLIQLKASGECWTQLAEDYKKENKRIKNDTGPDSRGAGIVRPGHDGPDAQGIIQSPGFIINSSSNDKETLPAKYEDEAGDLDNKEEGIFTSEGGLVVLHPFIVPFFRNMGLLTGDLFTGFDAQQTGIRLLHYLATGKNECVEHELVIAKTLCGYPLQQLVDSSITLNKDRLNAADELLEDVIGQWEALQNSSRAALREGFLQREARLSFGAERDLLQVERKGIDVLLDRLPWSIQYVKLPWMKKILCVDWSK